MGKVIVKRDTTRECFARLELSNGDQVIVSIAEGKVKVSGLKWAGMLRGPTLWQSEIAKMADPFFDNPTLSPKPIDAVIEKVIDCRSAAEVVIRLSAKPSEVLSQYAAALENTGSKVVRDLAELPFPKDMIKSALRHYLKKVNAADQTGLDALKVAYLWLSNFQALTEEERNAVSRMEGVYHAPDDKLDGGETYNHVLYRWHADAAALLDELRSVPG
jgi:hypothetical protein